MSGPPIYPIMKKVVFTPIDLGSKLLNWWDGTIVDEDPTTEVNTWQDQKGSFDWQNVGAAKKPEYDSANDLIIFDSSNQERLSNDTNVAGFNRSDGEYWIVIDVVLGIDQIFITTTFSGLNSTYFMLQAFANKIRILTRNEGVLQNIVSTTSVISGKNIIRIKSSGSTYTVNLNNIDISSEFSSGNGDWESLIASNVNTVSIAALIRPATEYANVRIHAVLRCDATLTGSEVLNMYRYLKAKY